MKKESNWTDKDYILHMFHNDFYLKKKCKQFIEINTTNDWGFNGIRSKKWIMQNGSSYENVSDNNFDGGTYTQEYIFRIGRKIVTKEEWLKFNNIKRLTSVKDWKHPAYNNRFDQLIEDYVKYKI